MLNLETSYPVVELTLRSEAATYSSRDCVIGRELVHPRQSGSAGVWRGPWRLSSVAKDGRRSGQVQGLSYLSI